MNLTSGLLSRPPSPSLKRWLTDSIRPAASVAVEPDEIALRRRIHLLIGPDRGKAAKLLKRLLRHEEWEVTASTLDGLAEVQLQEFLSGSDIVVCLGGAEFLSRPGLTGCPVILLQPSNETAVDDASFLSWSNVGAIAEKLGEVEDWLERAFNDGGALLELWQRNLRSQESRVALPLPKNSRQTPPRLNRNNGKTPPSLPGPRHLLLCDLHTHSTWSDGKLTVPELVDFYGSRGFDCLCLTDHLCDPHRLLGKLVNLTGLVIPPDRIEAYFAEIEREKTRAWTKYGLLLMAGIEFNKDGYTSKSSTHLLGIDLKAPIDPTLGLKELIAAIHDQGGLAVASHPHEVKSDWGRNTLHLWEHREEYAPLLDAWEIANRDDIFNPVGLKKLPFIANSDFHKPKHINSWKTVLHCEKTPEAIKQCIRANRDVAIVLYRGQRFAGLAEAPE